MKEEPLLSPLQYCRKIEQEYQIPRHLRPTLEVIAKTLEVVSRKTGRPCFYTKIKQTTIAEKLGCSERTVRRHITRLVNHGILEVKFNYALGKQNCERATRLTSTVYFESYRAYLESHPYLLGTAINIYRTHIPEIYTGHDSAKNITYQIPTYTGKDSISEKMDIIYRTYIPDMVSGTTIKVSPNIAVHQSVSKPSSLALIDDDTKTLKLPSSSLIDGSKKLSSLGHDDSENGLEFSPSNVNVFLSQVSHDNQPTAPSQRENLVMVPSTTSPVVNLSQNPSQEQIVYENKYEDYLALAEADLEALDERIAIMQESGVPAQVAIDTCKYRAWHVTIDGVEYSRVTRPMSLAEFKASYPDVQSFRAYAVGVFQIDCSDDSSAPSTLVSL